MINKKSPAFKVAMLSIAALLLNNPGKVFSQTVPTPVVKIEDVIMNPVLLFTDPLTFSKKVSGEASKRVTGGEFTAQGWKTTDNKNQIMIEIEGGDDFDGALEIDLIDLDWKKANTSHKQDKIAFLSMFSNPIGCPHVDHGATNMDALWMLRSGRKPDNTPFFDEGFKIYWSALGASQAEPSLYYEEIPIRFERNEWPGWKQGINTIRVHWSKERYRFGVSINGKKIFEKAYEHQTRPFKYIFIGKSSEFEAIVGPTFSNLRMYGTRPDLGHTIPVSNVIMHVPANGSFFDLGTPVPFVITPRVKGEKFKKVEFFAGTEKIGEDLTYPFTLSWQPKNAGLYKVKAVATDKKGKVQESFIKNVNIYSLTQ